MKAPDLLHILHTASYVPTLHECAGNKTQSLTRDNEVFLLATTVVASAVVVRSPMASSWVERALRPRSEIRSCSTYSFGLGFRVYNLLDNGSFRYYSYQWLTPRPQ